MLLLVFEHVQSQVEPLLGPDNDRIHCVMTHVVKVIELSQLLVCNERYLDYH